MPFPPSAACRFFDLPPVNLQNLPLHLTKNAFASAPTHLCGIALVYDRNKTAFRGYHGRQFIGLFPFLIPSPQTILHFFFGCRANERSALIVRFAAVWATVRQRRFSKVTATLLQSHFLLKTCCYRDKIFVCYCRVVPVRFQGLFKSFCAVLGIAKQDARKS